MNDSALKRLADSLEADLADMTEDERVDFFHLITNDYCYWCGRATPDNQICHCTNDE